MNRGNFFFFFTIVIILIAVSYCVIDGSVIDSSDNLQNKQV